MEQNKLRNIMLAFAVVIVVIEVTDVCYGQGSSANGSSPGDPSIKWNKTGALKQQGQQGTVTGTVSYRQRIALPPQAVLRVELVDVSRADALATVITEQTIETKGKQVPIPFSLSYDLAQIKETNRYQVQAKILIGETQQYINSKAYPVITQGNPHKVQIVMQPVSTSKATGGDASKGNTTLRGMYSYMADAGMFTDCRTGKKYPVAQEGDNAALESAYGKARKNPGEPVLVNIEGRIVTRPKMEGSGNQQVILVDRFLRTSPRETCEKAQPAAKLENTYWKLVELNGQPVSASSPSREAYLQLNSSNKRLQGNSGCNTISGGYQVTGKRIKFTKIIATKMACMSGMEVERDFLGVLEAANNFKLSGRQLELYNDDHPLARFEAGQPK